MNDFMGYGFVTVGLFCAMFGWLVFDIVQRIYTP